MPGGRPKGTTGTPQKRRLLARLEADFPEYHPIAAMAEMLHDPDQNLTAEQRISLHSQIAKYVEPQLKAIEHRGEDGGPLRIILSNGDRGL